MKHPELDRMEREFRWQVSSLATWVAEKRVWVSNSLTNHASVYADETWRGMDQLLDESWWYSTRNEILLSELWEHALGSCVWDIGSGTGVVGRFLQNNGIPTICVEPSLGGAEAASARGLLSICASLEELRLPHESISAITLFDVLEHLENRQITLTEIHRVLAPRGLLILTLPALKSLWSQFDVEAGHYVRYSRRSIRRELERSGFSIVKCGYFFSLTVLPLFLLRVIPYRLGYRRALATEATVAASGGMIGRIAARLERAIAMRTPLGSSLLVVARK